MIQGFLRRRLADYMARASMQLDCSCLRLQQGCDECVRVMSRCDSLGDRSLAGGPPRRGARQNSYRVLAEKEGRRPRGPVTGVIGMERASHSRHGGNVRTRPRALRLVTGVRMVGAMTGAPVASPLPAGSPDRP